MIRINLLGVKKKKKFSGPSRFSLILIGVILGSLLVAGGVTLFFQSRVSLLQERVENNKALLVNLNQKINEVKRYEKLNQEFQQRTALIESLRRNQSVPARILEEASGTIPEGVWLTSLAYRSPLVTLEGYAFTNMDVVAYIDNLKNLSSITDVTLLESRQGEVERVSVYKFNLSFKVKV